ncbi:XRE family transcriptional regulator [Rhodococcus sp. IEGM 1409]|uniref:helix-turn-helix domain-containing protein n=1 Tax=Rhodococcus sp. IEGM 1409 TaxID=3047082 RepID=UPI0024B7FB48|nr:XRE family transcriptional regulator [Rhodococcus sp. IEGM 1409]MDI9901347.1 XRE family transcriptional regulator [Rhodococcus sp. IEGM 1409]
MTSATDLMGNEGETVASAVARRVRQELAGKPRRISQASIAEATGMTQQMLSSRMIGKVEFGVEEVTRVCAFAELDLVFVMTGQRMPRQVASGEALSGKPTQP